MDTIERRDAHGVAIPLQELWELPFVPLNDFLASFGYGNGAYYALKKKGLTIPTKKFGKKRIVEVKAARAFFDNLPTE